MSARRPLLLTLTAALALLCVPGLATAQQPFPVLVASAVELSGDGAIAGNNFNNGLSLAFAEINAAGGILGHRVEVITLDTQTDPEVARAAVRKAAEIDAYAIMGPVFSGMVAASADEIRRAGIPAFIGADATALTMQGNPYLFRTSLSQAATMPRLARYVRDGLRAETVAMVWVDNEFGRGGREAMAKALAEQGLRLVADIPTAPDQADFADPVAKVAEAKADVAFIYLNEDEAALCLRELHGQAYGGWIVGETTLLSQSVIELAGDAAANGVRGHTGLSPDALLPGVREFSNKFLREFKYKSDHNGMKGYTAAYVLKAATEKVGRFDREALAAAMRGLALSAEEHPGVLLDVRYDERGDLDRASFIVQVSGRQHQFVTMLPATAGGF